jgi:GT2 family glycosyltransferase
MGQQNLVFSVVIPTYNRLEQLLNCLQALARQEYGRDCFEVIVVSDGGEFPTDSRFERLRGEMNLTILQQPHAGPACARNTGASQARGRFLAFTDDDCLPKQDWLGCLASRVAVSRGCAFGGRTVNALPGNLCSVASQLLVDYLYAFHSTNPGQRRFFATNNLVVSTENLHAVGGFDATYPLAAGEDREFCGRLRKNGIHFLFVPEAVVYHAHAMTVVSFARQQFNYGCGSFLFHYPEGRQKGIFSRFESLSFYLKLLAYPFSHASGTKKIPLALLFLLSQVAVTVGYFREAFLCGRKRHSDRRTAS